MSIQAILIPAKSVDTLEGVIGAALIVARRFDSHIAVLHVSEPAGGQINSVQETIAGEISEYVGRFSRRRRIDITDRPNGNPGVTISFHHEIGHVKETLVHWSRLFDTTAVLRPAQSRSLLNRGLGGSTLETIMMSSGRPVLMVPPNWEAHKVRHALIPWNHRLEVTRALAMTLPWLIQMKKVTVVVPRKYLENGHQVVEYLGWHGAHAEVEILNRRTQSVGKRILKICENNGADFLVMGGYSHSRLKGRVFGGVTDYVLGHSEIITVIAH